MLFYIFFVNPFDYFKYLKFTPETTSKGKLNLAIGYSIKLAA